MPEITVANVYEVVVHGIVQTEETINRYFYASADEIALFADWVSQFVITVLNPMIPIMHAATIFDSLTIQQVKGGNSFFSIGVSVNGSASGEGLPPFASWDFTLVRGGARERNGYKRIAGIPENKQAYGVAISGVLADLAAVATGMFTEITTDDGTFFPVIRRTAINTVPQVPPKYFDISGVVYSKIGTQNSRKFGHGR